MERVLNIVVLGRAARNTANIKQRQPIGTMYVKSVVLADSLVFGSTDGYVKEWDLNGEAVTIGVKKN